MSLSPGTTDMVPKTQPRPPRNSSRVNLLISLVFHG